MSEKFYVVSESELERLREAAFEVANSHPARVDEIREAQEAEKRAEAACRAKPIPEDTLKIIFLRPNQNIAEYDLLSK